MINAFDFDEKAFREYYLLRLYVHDSHVAPKRIGLYVFLLIPGVTIDLVLVLFAWRDMAGWGVVDDLTMLATIVAFPPFFRRLYPQRLPFVRAKTQLGKLTMARAHGYGV